MVQRLSRRVTPSMAVALLALFVALGGVGVAATGGNFILGNPNTATTSSSLSAPVAGKALQVTNTNTTAGATALGLTVAAGHPPLVVNSITKVANLNADQIDGFDSAVFLRKGVAHTAAVSAAGGVLDVRNTGTTNGVQGRTTSDTASGVYGQNDSVGGYGVAGRASGGVGVYGESSQGGFAGHFAGNVLVDGELDCSGCVGADDIAGPVADAGKLDGIDSGDFVQGRGRVAGRAQSLPRGTHQFLGPPLLGFLRLSYNCPATTTNDGGLFIYNDSGSVANVFVDNGHDNPTYRSMNPGEGAIGVAAALAGDSFRIQAHGAPGVLTIDVATVNRANDCHAQAQALLTGQ